MTMQNVQYTENANTLKSSTLKKTIASGLAIALLSIIIGGAAIAANHSEQPIYRDGNFAQVSSQLRQNLRSSGYYEIDIQAARNDRINVYAKKNNQPYELRYTYPDLKLVSLEQKTWSKVKQDKDNHHKNSSSRYNDNY